MLRLFCLLTVLLPRLVLAVCVGISVWPTPGHPLPANGQVMLEGYGDLHEALAHVGEQSTRLVAEDDAVVLRDIALHRGELRLSQAVLKPERPLRPDKRYALRPR